MTRGASPVRGAFAEYVCAESALALNRPAGVRRQQPCRWPGHRPAASAATGKGADHGRGGHAVQLARSLGPKNARRTPKVVWCDRRRAMYYHEESPDGRKDRSLISSVSLVSRLQAYTSPKGRYVLVEDRYLVSFQCSKVLCIQGGQTFGSLMAKPSSKGFDLHKRSELRPVAWFLLIDRCYRFMKLPKLTILEQDRPREK